MSTHPLPPQTKNLSVNLPERAKAAFGRLAFVRGNSGGKFEMLFDVVELHAMMLRKRRAVSA